MQWVRPIAPKGKSQRVTLQRRPCRHCHRPIIIRNDNVKLGETLNLFEFTPSDSARDVIGFDTILVWTGRHRRIITGADVLGKLMREIGRLDAIEVDIDVEEEEEEKK